MTDDTNPLPELDGGPHDVEFFLDPACPFAWQTSVWLRRVAELRDLSIGWRFISLQLINEGKERSERARESQGRSHRFLRIAAAARDRVGNDAVGDLYRAWGERYWYTTTGGDLLERLVAAVARVDPGEIVRSLGLPEDLPTAADDASWDLVIRAESDEAFRRTGPDVGTPILTYGPAASGQSYFGPVISTVPDDAGSLALYDAVRVLAGLPGFAELKRSRRAGLDLPIFAT